MTKNLRFGLLLVLAASFVLSACEIVDDQSALTSEHATLVNPAPKARDFKTVNAAHKVLLGVIDSGVDYNHPLLTDNMHYELDETGKPVGVGRDYPGKDNWPSPYIARSSLYDTDEKTKAKAIKIRDGLEGLLKERPEFAAFINPERNVGQEVESGSYHGTHVAGLMVYDRPDFGLKGYRVLPHNRKDNDPYGMSHDYTKDFMENLLAAMNQAGQDGVRVANMSLGMAITRPKPGTKDEKTLEEYKKLLAYLAQVRETALKYPNTLYVIAAGNDGGWLDGKNRRELPCNSETANVLCVGALSTDGEPTTFTNIVLADKVDVVYAVGEDVLSTVPTEMCLFKNMNYLVDGDSGKVESAYLDGLAKTCAPEKRTGLTRLSGTSMASPLVAHAAAEVAVENPTFTAAQVIQALYKRAEPSSIGRLPVLKLRLKKPSWYKTTPEEDAPEDGGYWNTNRGSEEISLKPAKAKPSKDSEYFEFTLVPRKRQL